MKATAIAVMIVFRYKTKIVKNLKFLIKNVEIAQKYPSDDTYNMYDFRNW